MNQQYKLVWLTQLTQEGVVYKPFVAVLSPPCPAELPFTFGANPSHSFQNSVKLEEDLTKYTPHPSTEEISPLQKNPTDSINIKNIIPNLARKLIGFLASKECKNLVYKLYPDLEKREFAKILAFISGIRNRFGRIYVGRKDLMKIWFQGPKSQRSPQFYEILRRVSHHYLEHICPNSILLSKKIKKSLKRVHLQYRRKLVALILDNTPE